MTQQIFYANTGPTEGQEFIRPEWIDYVSKRRWAWSHDTDSYEEILCDVGAPPAPPPEPSLTMIKWIDQVTPEYFLDVSPGLLVRGDLINVGGSEDTGSRFSICKTFLPEGKLAHKVMRRHQNTDLSTNGTNLRLASATSYAATDDMFTMVTNRYYPDPGFTGMEKLDQFVIHRYAYPELLTTGNIDPPGWSGFVSQVHFNAVAHPPTNRHPSIAVDSLRRTYLMICANESHSPNTGRALICRVNEAGVLDLQYSLNTGIGVAFTRNRGALATDNANNVYVMLSIDVSGTNFFAKVSPSGSLVYCSQFETKGFALQNPHRLVVHGNYGYYASGPQSEPTVYVVKIDLSTGVIVKALSIVPEVFGVNDWWGYTGTEFYITADEQMYFSEILYQDDPYYEDVIVVSLDFATGTVNWTRRIRDTVDAYMWTYGLSIDANNVAVTFEDSTGPYTCVLPLADGGPAVSYHERLTVTDDVGLVVSDAMDDLWQSTYGMTLYSEDNYWSQPPGTGITSSSAENGVVPKPI